MSEQLTPEKIFQNILNNNISKIEATELLISLIEESDNTELRVKSIEIFNKLSVKSKKVFKILERCLISDENYLVRAIAAETIFLNFLDHGISTLKWAIQHETSPLVLRILGNLLKKAKPQCYKILYEAFSKRLERIASIYGVVSEEALFILDLDIDINTNAAYKLGSSFNYIYKNYTIFKVKNEHLKALSFSLKKTLPNSISSLSKLRILDLSFNNLTKLPNSLSCLSQLKILNLSWNNFTSFPDVLIKLNSLKELDLSYNNIREVPESIRALKSLESLNLKNNKIQKISESVVSLKKLKFFYY